MLIRILKSALPVKRNCLSLPITRTFYLGGRKANLKKNDTVLQDEDLGPIKYSASKAAQYQAAGYRMQDERLWYEHYVIHVCVAAFMIYFCILREENDVDEKLKEVHPIFKDYDPRIIEAKRRQIEKQHNEEMAALSKHL